jgi:uridine kinase
MSMPSTPITPFLIGVSGGPCSGKSTVCQNIVEALQPKDDVDQTNRVAVIAMEHFYRPKTAEQRDMALRGNYNLDHPSAFDEKLLFNTLQDLLNGQTVKVK